MSTEAEIQAAADRALQAENQRAVEAWNNRTRIPTTSPSPRKPDSSIHFNDADQIEIGLREDGHRTWGFVIYRTCYSKTDDADWPEFLARLRFQMERTFDSFNGRDISGLFTLAVFEDPALDGASTATVRERFVEWRGTAPQLEQGSEAQPGKSPRYRFAIQVDAASLHAVTHEAPAPDVRDLVATRKGWVKLIDASWMSALSDSDEEDEEDEHEPIEGVTEMDVGWVKIPYASTVEYYVNSRNWNWWPTSYLRPPATMGWPYT